MSDCIKMIIFLIVYWYVKQTVEKLSPINGKKDGLNPISRILSRQKATVTSTLDTIKPLLMKGLDAKQTPKISTKFSTAWPEQNPSGIPLT